MIRRFFRAIARWHHRQNVKDCDFALRVHTAHLAALPAEIDRVTEIRRYHQGRLATLGEKRNPLNYRLGRSRLDAR